MAKFKPVSARMRRAFEAHGCVFKEEMFGEDTGAPVLMHPIYGSDGGYVDDAVVSGNHIRWLARNGIWTPLARGPGRTACYGKATKGKCAGKWVGWSHRGAAAFGIGDMQFDASLLGKLDDDTNPWHSTPFNKVGTVEIRNDEEAKQAAIALAAYLS